jgi:hypothetical protein
MGKVDPDGRDTWDLISGVANAIGSDNLIGAGRVSGGNSDFQAGQHIGDFVASIGGLVEAGTGTSVEAVGVVLDATGVGAIAGVPANVAGATMIVHGATTAVVGTVHMSSSVNQMNKDVKTGKAPGEVKRADKGNTNVKGEQDHVHFNDKKDSALNKDGSWKHGATDLKKATLNWLEKHGWTLPWK